jgi:hypothetical protein
MLLPLRRAVIFWRWFIAITTPAAPGGAAADDGGNETVKNSLLASGAALLLSFAGMAAAHHSFAMFDRKTQVELVGTVKEFQWTNPHSWIEVDVPNAQGGSDKWSVECNSPNNLARAGWRSTSLKPGDKVTVVIHPLRNGDKGGLFVSVKLANGQTLTDPMGLPPPMP